MLNLPDHVDNEVVACRKCGGLYLWPAISDEMHTELYGKSYFTGATADDNSAIGPAARYDFEHDCSQPRFGKFRESVETMLRYRPNARSILDIGAATGDFLAIARERGLSVVTGIELSSYAAALAKEKYGFEFHQTELSKYPGTEKYDLIHLNHVFEHFTDPHAALQRIGALLKPGGLVYVEVPFQFNLIETTMHKLTGRKKAFDLFSVHHPVFFRPITLRKIFSDHKFRCVSLRIFGMSRYPTSTLAQQIKRFVWFAVSLMGQGLFIEAYFEKPEKAKTDAKFGIRTPYKPI